MENGAEAETSGGKSKRKGEDAGDRVIIEIVLRLMFCSESGYERSQVLRRVDTYGC